MSSRKSEDRKKHDEYNLATKTQTAGAYHVLGNKVLLLEFIEGRMKGKALRGRKRLHMLSDIVSSAK